MTRGRCGLLLLHRDGLAPSTPCRSPGALRSSPIADKILQCRECPLCARSGHPAALRQSRLRLDRVTDIIRSEHELFHVELAIELLEVSPGLDIGVAQHRPASRSLRGWRQARLCTARSYHRRK